MHTNFIPIIFLLLKLLHDRSLSYVFTLTLIERNSIHFDDDRSDRYSRSLVERVVSIGIDGTKICVNFFYFSLRLSVIKYRYLLFLINIISKAHTLIHINWNVYISIKIYEAFVGSLQGDIHVERRSLHAEILLFIKKKIYIKDSSKENNFKDFSYFFKTLIFDRRLQLDGTSFFFFFCYRCLKYD